MSDKYTFNRVPLVIVEIVQPRCSNHFGVSPCTATGAPKCYNCYWTCKDTDNYNTDGEIVWRFCKPGAKPGWLYEQADADNIKTNAIPLLKSVTTTSSRINPGASRAGESPLGIKATASVVFDNAVWDDHVGDYYLSDRTAPASPAGFFTLMLARNPLQPGWALNIYEGYEGQALSAMEKRSYDLESLSGPSGGDTFTAGGRDPLDKVRGKNALYPPTSDIQLAQDISDSTTSIPVTCLEAQLTLELGNDTDRKYIVIGDEIIGYTGQTGTAPDFTLTGVTRGMFQTAASTHSQFDAVQRGARHVQQEMYKVARYIIEDHSPVDSSYIDDTSWDSEGGSFLSSFRCDTFLGEPEPVETLLGELCRDGLFSIWWDERGQKIPLLAVRPPQETPQEWTDANNVLGVARSVSMDDRMTRIVTFFTQRNPIESLDDKKNFANRRIRIDAEVETENAAGGGIYENVIYSRWISTFANALLAQASLLQRFRLPPEYAKVSVDAKDRDVEIGDVIDLNTRGIREIEGNATTTRWQVIGVNVAQRGSRLDVDLQSYTYVGKFCIIMANDAPDYASATDAEKLSGCWMSENDGTMPDGSDPYLLQ